MKVFYLIFMISIGFSITTQDIYDNSWALIIGIDKYESVRKLNYAVKDAESMQEILLKTFEFPFENVTLLTNEQANKQNILKSFSDITKNANANDRVIIFFAGHGETMDLPEGGEMGYLLPVDGKREDLYLSSIGMDELKKLSLMSKAKHVLYLIDACYGGIAAIGSRGLEPETTPNYIEKITKDKSRQIITAGGKGEQVIEKSEWGHSAFSLNLKRGLKEGRADLNSDGYITANELALFLSEKVTIDSENQQTPQFGRMTSQEGEFVFIYSENTIVNQNVESKSTNEKLDLLISEIKELKSQNKNIEKEVGNNKYNEDDFIPNLLFHMMFGSFYNLNNTVNELYRGVMGLSYEITPDLAFQVGWAYGSYDRSYYDDNYNGENNGAIIELLRYYSSSGLRVGVNKKIFNNFLSSQVGISIAHSQYDIDGEVDDNHLSSGMEYSFDLGLTVIFPWWDSMSFLFSTGYDLNEINDEKGNDLLNSPYFGGGIQILGDWF